MRERQRAASIVRGEGTTPQRKPGYEPVDIFSKEARRPREGATVAAAREEERKGDTPT